MEVFDLNQITEYHSIFKYENSNLMIKLDNMDYSSINQYSPINLPSLINALSLYINVHDLLKLLMLSKSFRLAIQQEKINFFKTHQDYVKNAADHCCFQCVKYFYSIKNIQMLYLSVCQTGNKPIFELVEPYLFYTNPNKDYIYQCVKILLKHEKMIKKLLPPLLNYPIQDEKTIELIVSTGNETYIRRLFEKPWPLTSLLLLPYACQYNMIYKVHTFLSTLPIKQLSYLYELMQNKYSDDIMKVLLLSLLRNNYPLDNVVYWANQYSSSEIWHLVFNYPIDNKACVAKGYEYNIKDNYDLDNTKEENKLSIQLASKYSLSSLCPCKPIYTSQLTADEILEQFLLIESTVVKYELIKHLAKKNLDNVNLIELLEWINKHEISQGLDLMPKLSDDMKLYLVPLAYKHNQTANLLFLRNSKELNLLSIQEANKHYMNNYIYVNHLTNDDLLKSLVNAENKYVKKILIYHIKVNFEHLDKRTTYKLSNEIHYYKIKILTNSIKNIEQCINMDKNAYDEILYRLSTAPSIVEGYIKWLINHELFKTITEEDVLRLLKLFPSNIVIINQILSHPCFEKYK